MEIQKSASLRDVLTIFFKNKKQIFFIFSAAMLSAFFYCIFTTEIYRAEVDILIQMGREKVASINTMSTDSGNIFFQERSQNINNELNILKGNFLFTETFPKIKKILINPYDQNLYTDIILNSNEQLCIDDNLLIAKPIKNHTFLNTFKNKIKSVISSIKKVSKNIIFYPFYTTGLMKKFSDDELMKLTISNAFGYEFVEDTDIIKLSFEGDDPLIAALIVNLYAKEYIKYHTKIYKAGESFNLYSNQTNLYKTKLNAIEKELIQIYKTQNITNIEKQKDILLSEISSLNEKHLNVELHLNNISSKASDIKKMLATKNQWIETPNIGQLGQNLTDLSKLDKIYFELKAEKAKLLTKFSIKSKDILNINLQMKEIKKQKATSLLNLLLIEKHSLLKQKEILTENLFKKQKKSSQLATLTIHLDQLNRSRKIAKDNFFMLQKKADNFRIYNELDKNNILSIKIINPALPPIMPVHPKKKIILLTTALLSLFMGFGYCVIREYFSQGFKDRKDFETQIDIPLLAIIPVNDNFKKVEKNFETDSKSLHATHEIWETLYKSLEDLKSNSKHKIDAFVFTSAKKGEGTSTIAINFAIALKTNPKNKVLLVDANLRSPVLHTFFNIKKDNGLIEFVNKKADLLDVLVYEKNKDFFILPAGSSVDSFSLFFQSDNFSEAIETLKKKFTYIIFVSGPVLTCPETSALACKTDGLIMVVESEKTKAEILHSAKHYLVNSKVNILGAILNKKKHYIPESIYRRL